MFFPLLGQSGSQFSSMSVEANFDIIFLTVTRAVNPVGFSYTGGVTPWFVNNR